MWVSTYFYACAAWCCQFLAFVLSLAISKCQNSTSVALYKFTISQPLCYNSCENIGSKMSVVVLPTPVEHHTARNILCKPVFPFL